MEKFKAYGSVFLAMLSCYTLGLYSMSSMYHIKGVEPHQWILTSLFGIIFLIIGIKKISKL